MKNYLMLIILIFTVTIAHAETYKWEDANGMYFTENPLSIPLKYRAKALADHNKDIPVKEPKIDSINSPKDPWTINSSERVKNENNPVINETQIRIDAENKRQAIEKANREQTQIRAEEVRQQQEKSKIENNKFIQKAKNSFAITIIALFLFGIFWIVSLISAITSEFKKPSDKTMWILLLIFIAPLGAILYPIFSGNQKIK
jgi:cation transport ATPase